MGRPTKLTTEVQSRICLAIADGNYYEAACAVAGVGYSTFRAWMEKGEQAKSGPYREFLEAVEKAAADAEATIVAQWRQHIPENWQAARDFLARRYPDRWGPKERKDISLGGDLTLGIVEEIVDADGNAHPQEGETTQGPGGLPPE